MNTPVLDCSVVCAWFFGDENAPDADAVLERVAAIGALAPGLWWAEVRNALVMAERRGRMTPSQTHAAVAEVEALGVELDHAPDGEVVLRLAREHRLSVYDALYLELATRTRHPLASLDRALLRAARAENVRVNL